MSENYPCKNLGGKQEGGYLLGEDILLQEHITVHIPADAHVSHECYHSEQVKACHKTLVSHSQMSPSCCSKYSLTRILLAISLIPPGQIFHAPCGHAEKQCSLGKPGPVEIKWSVIVDYIIHLQVLITLSIISSVTFGAKKSASWLSWTLMMTYLKIGILTTGAYF